MPVSLNEWPFLTTFSSFHLACLSLQDSDIQKKIDHEIRMRDGACKLLAACSQRDQALEAAKSLQTCSTRIMAYMSELQRMKEAQVMQNVPRRSSDAGPMEDRLPCKGKDITKTLFVPLLLCIDRGPKYHLLAHTTLSLSHVQDSFRTHDLTILGNGSLCSRPAEECSYWLPLYGSMCCRLAAQPHCMTQQMMGGWLKVKASWAALCLHTTFFFKALFALSLLLILLLLFVFALQQCGGDPQTWTKVYAILKATSLFCYQRQEDVEASVEPALTIGINKELELRSQLGTSPTWMSVFEENSPKCTGYPVRPCTSRLSGHSPHFPHRLPSRSPVSPHRCPQLGLLSSDASLTSDSDSHCSTSPSRHRHGWPEPSSNFSLLSSSPSRLRPRTLSLDAKLSTLRGRGYGGGGTFQCSCQPPSSSLLTPLPVSSRSPLSQRSTQTTLSCSSSTSSNSSSNSEGSHSPESSEGGPFSRPSPVRRSLRNLRARLDPRNWLQSQV
ncbi:hypothetical protein XENOCAPTIV_008442 [Xenoophorus captivus]|uniref:REM-1 domain-containing protein n=1 Tax=Xenoophorus captivus TaxID=1517983 RepID=A0ABV0RXK5_9TELE